MVVYEEEAGESSIAWQHRHSVGGTAGWMDSRTPWRVGDVGNLVYRFGHPGLHQIPGSIVIGSLPETFPVPGVFERTTLPERCGGHGSLDALERQALHFPQPMDAVVGAELIEGFLWPLAPRSDARFGSRPVVALPGFVRRRRATDFQSRV